MLTELGSARIDLIGLVQGALEVTLQAPMQAVVPLVETAAGTTPITFSISGIPSKRIDLLLTACSVQIVYMLCWCMC